MKKFYAAERFADGMATRVELEKVRILTSKKDSCTDLATVKVIGAKAYAYIDTVPCFHRGVHEEILRNEGINPNDISWAFSEEEMRMVKKHTH